MSKYTYLFIGLVLVVAAISASFFDTKQTTSTHAQTIKQALGAVSPRPEFSLPDLHGQQRNIKEWDGKYIVLNFWATWCTPCRKEIPEFIELQNQYRSSNLQFIGVAIDDKVSVDQFAMEMGMNYPNLIADIHGIELAKQYGNLLGALPYSVIIDPQGNIIDRQIGLLSGAKILAKTGLTLD
ncbi:MAG: redoxin [Cycloclasticus sp.]|nr:MAG: redoxin [Cycloclasticus sp.]